MKQFFRKLFGALIALAVIVTLAHPTAATTVVMLSDEDLIMTSRLILTGNVQSAFSAWDDSGSMIWTYVEIKTEQILKGKLSTDTIVLKQAGGIVGEEGIRILGQPGFKPSDEVLLYLNVGPDGTLRVAHCFMGMFSILTDATSGSKYVERWSDHSEVTRVKTSAQEPNVTDRAPFELYLKKIRDTLKGAGVSLSQQGAVDGSDFVAVPREYHRKKRESRAYSPDYVLTAGGVRWMQADSGQPVVYSLNPADSPIAGGGTAEITRALSAWSAQSGANIHMQLGSQTSACGLVTDGVNSISYGDCRNQLDPPVGCSGVLAQTQVAYTNETRVVSGQSFRSLIEADVIFNKGFSCFLSNSANLAETACHELGHSIGLAHPPDPSAIMFAQISGGGRDATLGADDKAGVLFIYPSSGGGGGGGGEGSPVAITTSNLPRGTAGQFYQQSLSAAGGTQPYTWRLLGGQAPPGLSLSGSGVLVGNPIQSGSFSFTVQVIDSTPGAPRTDSKVLTVSIDAGQSLFPIITSIKVRGAKKLWINGANFRSDSLIVLNGILVSPREFDVEGSTTSLLFKGKLNLGPAGTNYVQVINPNNSSAPFFF